MVVPEALLEATMNGEKVKCVFLAKPAGVSEQIDNRYGLDRPPRVRLGRLKPLRME
jgi:hypothetical protein